MSRKERPAKDDRPGILVAHEMPDHGKIAPLSDAGFRLLVRVWCFSSRLESNGKVPDEVWREMGTAKARRELMAAPKLMPNKSPLVVQCDGYVECHDYLAHQRAADEIDAIRASRSESGEKGAHMRWHVGRRARAKGCIFCEEEAKSA